MKAQVGHVIHLVWQVYLLIVLKGVQVSTPLLKPLVQVVKVVTPLSLSPPPPTTPFAPGSPYDARPGIQRFRGTPTPAPPCLSLSLSLSGLPSTLPTRATHVLIHSMHR